MRRVVSLLVVVALLTLYISPAVADVDDTVDPTTEQTSAQPDDESYMSCHSRGKLDASATSTGGSFVGGFCGGVLLGLIGAAIVVVAQSEPDPPALVMLELQTDECRYAYLEAYHSAGKSKKQTSALLGGLVGTAVIVTILLSSSN